MYYKRYLNVYLVPAGFKGEPLKLGEFVAVQSGSFTSPETWSERIVPYGNCSIMIPVSVRVILEKSTIDLNIRKLDIYGTLVLGSSTSKTVMFIFPPNIIVYANGTLIDNTSGNQIISPAGTLLTVYPNGSFIGNNTNITTPTTSRSLSTTQPKIALISASVGPLTLGILPGNDIQLFPKVTSIVTVSGTFTAASTWLGGIVPRKDVCDLVGGCGLSISSSFALSTETLRGELDINYNEISIGASAGLILGTPGSSAGFRFRYSVTLNCNGRLQAATGGTGSIFIPLNSEFNFFAGATFVSTTSVSLIIYNTATSATVGTALTLSSSLSGPYFVTVSSSGQVTTSITGMSFLNLYIFFIFIILLFDPFSTGR